MSGSRELADHVIDLLGPAAGVELRRFFGGWSLRRDGRQVGIVMDDVYVKASDPAARQAWRASGARPFTYEVGGRTVTVEAYWSAPPDAIDDGAVLGRVLDRGRPDPDGFDTTSSPEETR